ncbi:DUF4153 domain-containing protein [Brevundimonas kwangchunensis]|uniref:DUF4153 domain-containing protein n=1 Tax=Brevundimonas kwangchunensis TaxID=322163 RepID=A0ABP3S374_9CAUL
MTDTENAGRNSLGPGHPRARIWTRAAIGLLQGVALWQLQQTSEAPVSWPATRPELFVPVLLMLVLVPIILIASLGRMRLPTLAGWALAASAILALLGWHEVASQRAEQLLNPPYINSPMPLFAIAALFIGHHLVLAGDMNRRWIAPFADYFDTAWKSAVQLALSVGFTGAFWILLFLGSALFRVIGLTFLEDLLRKVWFSVPITTLAFAVAVHLTDVSDGIIRGVRTVALMLLSWLLLLMTVLAAGFVAALPFTGLNGLWDTGHGTSLVLVAVAALIVLINTAYQDGRAENRPPLVLQIATRVAAVLLAPLCIIVFWGLALRIGQHGLTPDRVIAFACALVGAVHAAGYAWAALRTLRRKEEWMRPLEPTNIAGAILAVILILALFSPVAAPARLSVADQVARLERGAVSPDRFDYRFLRFHAGRAGQTALAHLSRSTDPVIAREAGAAAAQTNRWDDEPAPVVIRPVYEIVPTGSRLPDGFEGSEAAGGARPEVCRKSGDCVASAVDVNDDGVMDVLVATGSAVQLWASEGSKWRIVGSWGVPACIAGIPAENSRVDTREALRAGRVSFAPTRWPDLMYGARRASFLPHPGCEPRVASDSAAD